MAYSFPVGGSTTVLRKVGCSGVYESGSLSATIAYTAGYSPSSVPVSLMQLSSSNSSTATVSAGGSVTAKSGGVTTLRAVFYGSSGSLLITVLKSSSPLAL